jgi:Zn-finger in ubiquitin-hydrolases and other protein
VSTSEEINPHVAPSGEGCAECLAGAEPGWWLHLRRCAACGHIGCCDNSPAQHASGHHEETGHPVLQSFEPGEDWFYDFRTREFFDGPALLAPDSHPLDQPVPGPSGKVPRDWQSRLR